MPKYAKPGNTPGNQSVGATNHPVTHTTPKSGPIATPKRPKK